MIKTSFDTLEIALQKSQEEVLKTPWRDSAWEFDWVQCVLNHGWTVDDYRKECRDRLNAHLNELESSSGVSTNN
jgi:hypothetical protein